MKPGEAALAPVALSAGAAPREARTPEWVHLLPRGTFKGRDGRGPWRVSDLAALIDRTRRQAGGRPLPIDYDHALDLARPKGQPTPAAGWVTHLDARGDGLWGKVEWTPRAARQIADREYRYLSPVIAHFPDGEVGAVLRVALTNEPNLGQLTALNAKGMGMDPEQMMGRLRELLGLAQDAEPDAIVEAVRQLSTARNGADPASFVPMALFERAVAEANRMRQGVSLQAAEMVVDEALRRGQMLPFMREWAVELCTTNKPAFDAFLAKVGPATTTIFAPHDFSAHHQRDRGAHGGAGGEGEDVFRALGLSQTEVKQFVRGAA